MLTRSRGHNIGTADHTWITLGPSRGGHGMNVKALNTGRRRSLGGLEIWPHKGYVQTTLDGMLGLWVETSAVIGAECVWP